MNEERINHMPTLRKLEKAGLIKLHEQTGIKITGLYDRKKFTCTYIDEAVNSSQFEFNGSIYHVKYVSGCFCPYVFQLTETNAAFKDGKFAFIVSKGNEGKVIEKGYNIRSY